ncbi:MAG: class I tRNA ligase family protein, partial [Phycisphaeraceae bacterium]
VLTRYHRMLGRNAMWMPGTDHAGIATQTVVDKRLQAEGQPALKDYKKLEAEGKPGREQFIGKVQAWKDEYEQRILHQLKAMGCSCDFDRTRFTMDDVCAAAVREAFFRLFKDGLIYRGKRLVNWDPVTQTALADDEVEMQEIDGNFYYMQYPVVDADGQSAITHVTVATTRPETMLGDTAVAINPKDPRAADLRGKFVKLPIVNRLIPIIEDDYVVLPDPDSDDAKAKYASGYLKVTPAHDPNDYEIGQRHDLPVINVMAPDASISLDHGWPAEDAAAADAFLKQSLVGQSREDARKAIVKWFKDHDLLEEIRPYRHSVGHSYRSHVPVEPYLSDQWYVAVKKQIERLPDEGTLAGTDVPANSLAGLALRAMADDQRDMSGAVGSSASSGAGVSPAKSRGVGPALSIHHRRLPHWQVGGSTYFVTFRLAQGELSPDERTIVLNACRHWHPQRMTLHLVTVMPDHVHMILTPSKKEDGTWHALDDLMHSIKSFTAHELNKQRGTAGPVWQDEYFDRIIRDQAEFEEKWNYICLNPVKAGVIAEDQEYPFTWSPGWQSEGREGGRDARPTRKSHPLDKPMERLRVGEKPWEGHLRFYPDRYAKSFQQWHEGIRDWCISRQLWWGHRIPVWTKEGPEIPETIELPDDADSSDLTWIGVEVKSDFHKKVAIQGRYDHGRRVGIAYACVVPGNIDIETFLEGNGWTRDPDVLDTWFSSALWPLSTMGWPNPERFPDEIPEGDLVLKTWNPTNTLTTAREIITLWVSRMVMFNLYFSDPDLDPSSDYQRLPFYDVFVHAMIQDGHGQKMSKSLGNGVDPMDILHTHGGDAMRFTLAQMTTHTQDVRLPVDLVSPYTGELFEPKFVTAKNGYKVMAPIQADPSDPAKKMATSYGVASGEVQPSGSGGDLPVARNTSSKFDLGRNFANKLWNAVRFALSNLEGAEAHGQGPVGVEGLSLPDKWILSRLARVVQSSGQSLNHYEFSQYAQTLYDFFWRDLCDWYIEAVKPTVAGNPLQRQVLATCIDASLRLLHPVMPFITERLWEHLNAIVPERGVAGVTLPASELLVQATWPKVARDRIDEGAEKTFELLRQVVSAARQVRTQHTVPPRQTVDLSAAAPPAIAQRLLEHQRLIDVLANVTCREIGPRVDRPADAAAAVTGDIELYLHGLIDPDTERQRLEKRVGELAKQIKTLQGRLSNESYVSKAPAKLVEESRDQLAAVEREAEAVQEQLAALK